VLELAEWSGRAASNLSRTLRHLERRGLVKMRRAARTPAQCARRRLPPSF